MAANNSQVTYAGKVEIGQGTADIEIGKCESVSATNENKRRPLKIFKPRTIKNRHRIGRNENCPCGSGRKFKYCHGRFV